MGVYNAKDHVTRAVSSIQEQTHSDWDLLVVDDASTDGTNDVLDALAQADSRVRVIHTERNLGKSACLNLGWKQAPGDLIARMDADDYSLPARLEVQATYMERHPDIAVLGTGAVLIDEEGHSSKVASRPEQHAELAMRMYKETPFFHPSVMVRRTFYESLGGYAPSQRDGEDLDLWLRGYRQFRYHNLQDPLIEYRTRQRYPLKTIASISLVLARSAHREHLLLSRGWYAPRYFAAALLAKLGLRKLRFE